MTTYDFNDGNGPVPAHQHPNGGGWVADTATVAATAYVGPDARVSGNALVSDNAIVYRNAQVSGDAKVYGDALVSKTPLQFRRSDGYDFVIVPCADNVDRIIAGCRYFTYEEAYNHWNKEHPKYKETNIILEALKKLYELQKSS